MHYLSVEGVTCQIHIFPQLHLVKLLRLLVHLLFVNLTHLRLVDVLLADYIALEKRHRLLLSIVQEDSEKEIYHTFVLDKLFNILFVA